MAGYSEQKIVGLEARGGYVPSLHMIVYAGCHPAGRRFPLGKFFAELVSW